MTAILGVIGALAFIGMFAMAVLFIRKGAADAQRAKDEAEARENADDLEDKFDKNTDRPDDPKKDVEAMRDGTY